MNLMLYKGNNKIIYERYKQDISKNTLQMQTKVKKPTFTQFNGQFGKGSVCLYILRFGF
jgi:hypothetical protein